MTHLLRSSASPSPRTPHARAGRAVDPVLRGFAALFVLGVVASACGGDEHAIAEASDAIIGGRVDRVHTAVGRLGTVPPGGAADDVVWHCSATLVGPSTVLTAAHCVTTPEGRRLGARRLRFGAAGAVWRAARVHVAPGYAPGAAGAWDDLALVELTRPVEGIAPLRRATTLDPPAEAGDRVHVIGFGVTRPTGVGTGTGAGTRRRAVVELSWVDDRELEYLFEGQGACFGDSGGPLVGVVAGEEIVVGVTSRGSGPTCRGLDVATRVDAFEPWIEGLGLDG